MSSQSRLWSWLLIATFLPWCWLAMMIVHESGHVIAAWLTGGVVTKVVVHPLSISRTDVNPNPMPIVVIWGGPVLGSLLPLCAWGVLKIVRSPLAFLARFFSGFCLIANGAYLGAGAFIAVGDAAELLKLGVPSSVLMLIGAITIPAGLVCWHGQGASFGLNSPSSSNLVIPTSALLTTLLLLATLLLECLLSERI